jgi:hypothetical protein
MFGAEQFPKISTGTDLVVSSSNMLANTGTGGSATVQPMSPMDSIREMFVDMRDSLLTIAQNTSRTNELLMGTPAQQRDEAIASGETDAPPIPEDDDTGPSFLDRLKGLNPFQGGIGTFGKVLLAVAGLLGLKLFGPQIQGGLAGILQAIADNKLSEKIGQAAEDLKTKGKELFTELQEGVSKLLEGISASIAFVKSIYTAINDYIMQFDTQGTVVYDSATGQTITTGDGKLDEEELGFLKDDLKEKAVNVIGNFLGDVLLAFGGLLLGTTFITTAAKALLGSAAIQRIFSIGPSFIGPLPAGAGLSPLLATGGIVSLLAYGITTTFKNFSNSLEETLKENNNEFEIKSFLSNFFGGNDEGGFMNALKQAFLVGGTGALGGMALGAKFAILGAPAGPAGIIAGGLLGIAIGGIIGAISGSYGSDKIKAMMDRFSDTINETIDKIDLFFTDILDNIRKFFTGEATAFELDPVRINQAIESEEAKIADLLERGFKEDSFAVQRRQKKINEYNKMLEELTPEKIEAARVQQGERLTMNVDNQLENLRASKTAAEGRLAELYSIPKDERSALQENAINTMIGIINQRAALIAQVEAEKQAILSDIGIDYEIPPVTNRLGQIMSMTPTEGSGKSAGAPDNLVVGSGNINTTNLSNINSFPGGFNVSNDFMTAVLMGDKKAKMS